MTGIVTVRGLIALLLVASGTALVLLGWQTNGGDGYLSSLLLDLGVTMFLVIPLVWLERLFERRVEASEQQTRQQVSGIADEVTAVSGRLEETRRNLDDLQEQMTAGLKRAADAESELVARARNEVSFETVTALFRRAMSLRAISGRGVRVAFPGRLERLRARLVSDSSGSERRQDSNPRLLLAVEDATGADMGVRTYWGPGQALVDALLQLVETWKRKGTYPGDSALQAGRIFDTLIASLDAALAERRRGGDNQLDPLIELLSPSWALTEHGLEHLPDYYAIRASELTSKEGLEAKRAHMRGKVWVLEEDEAARENGQLDFWDVSEIAHLYFSAGRDRRS